MAGTRKDTHRVTLKVAGIDFGEWEAKTGGKSSGNATMNKPGALKQAVSLGGIPTTDTITLTRNYDERSTGEIQGTPRVTLLNGLIGQDAIVRQAPLDGSGNLFGPTAVYDGILDAFSMPDTDSNSEDSAVISVDVAVNGVPTFV